MKLLGYAIIASILGVIALLSGIACSLYVLSQI
jgi:hypothetical protein